jgi:hypothetical protein
MVSKLETAREECEDLLDLVMGSAEEMLQQYGEFFPFGSALTKSNELANSKAWDLEPDDSAEQAVTRIMDGFKAMAQKGSIKACALVCNVNVVPPEHKNEVEAIAVHLEHLNQYSIVVFFPFRLENGDLFIDEPFAIEGKYEVFSENSLK